MAAIAKSRATVIFVGVWLALSAASVSHAQTLRITSPANGTVVNPGQALSVTVAADPAAIQSQGVAIIGQAPLETTPFRSSQPYQFSLNVPADMKAGQYTLTAIASLKGGGQLIINEIEIDIERYDAPQQIASQVSTLSFGYVRDSYYLDVTGLFSDGATVILTRSSLVSFSSDAPAVATVREDGLVTAIAPGNANIIVTYGSAAIGQSTIRIPVTVPPPLEVIPATVSLSLPASESVSFLSLAHMPGDVATSVEWSISPQVGRIDADGAYTAPASVASRQGVTVTATSVADPPISATAQIWLLPPAPTGTSRLRVNQSGKPTPGD